MNFLIDNGGLCYLKECEDIGPALADYKIARRHPEAQVETCQLTKEDRDGVTVYLWTEE